MSTTTDYLELFGYTSKEAVVRDAERYWNPDKTRFWQEQGVPLVIAERSGYRLTDVDGHSVYDVHLNGGTFNLGHRNPDIVAAIHTGVELLDVGNHHFPSAGRSALARVLVESVSGGSKVVFGSSGGESVDVAIKAARNATSRRKVVSIRKAYHGHTGYSIGTGDERFLRLFHSHSPDFVQVAFNSLDELEQVLAAGDVAAVILETIPATYGFPMPGPGYLASAQQLAHAHGAVFIADEVQTGLGRTGELWGYTKYGVEPDIVVTGKGLGGGMYPITAAILNERTSQWLEQDGFAHMSTFGGSELGCLVALRTLEITRDPRTVANIGARTQQFATGLDALREKFPRTVTGVRQNGLIIGLEFERTGALVVSRLLYEHGVWAIFATLDPSVLQLKPGVLLQEHEASEILSILHDVCVELEREDTA